MVGILLLIFEALTSVIEPYPIAYLVDFLPGAVRVCASWAGAGAGDVGTDRNADSADHGDRRHRRDQQCRRLLDRGLHGPGRTMARVQHPGGHVLPSAAAVVELPRQEADRRRAHARDRRRAGGRRVRGAVRSATSWAACWCSAGSLALLFCQSWNVALVALVVVPMLAFVSNFYSPGGSRRRRRPSAAERASWPPPPRRCSPRSGWCRATAAVGSTSSSSPRRPRRACAPPWAQRTSRRSSASSWR